MSEFVNFFQTIRPTLKFNFNSAQRASGSFVVWYWSINNIISITKMPVFIFLKKGRHICYIKK